MKSEPHSSQQAHVAEHTPHERIDVVLIYPPWPVLDDRAMLQNSLPPLGLLSIASALESYGQVVRVYDIHAEKWGEEKLRHHLQQDQPRFIGISVLTNMAIPAHKVAKICKEEMPDTTVVVGGIHAEAMPERMLRNPAIDLVVRGDGEEAMWEIVQGKERASIAGLCYRQEGKVQHNPARKVEMNLDRYPFPAYHLVNFKNYFPAVSSYRNLPAINMLMTRGCPGYCTFCNSARTTLRARSPDKVVQQILYLHETYGIRQVQFYDDTFTVLKRHVLEFCQHLEAANKDISWVAYIRGDCFSDKMAQAMKKAGCHQVLMGIETGNETIAARMKKPIRLSVYKEAVEIAHRHGLEVRGSFIIGHLDETWETMNDTLQFAIELNLDLLQLSISTPYPGTDLYQEAVNRGLLKHYDWYRYGQGSPLLVQEQLPEEEVLRFERHAFRTFYLRPKMILSLLKRMAHPRHLRDYFFAATTLLLGAHRKKQHEDWNCWINLKEEDFLELPLEEPKAPPLTWQLQQQVTIPIRDSMPSSASV
ncbi:B12-binding domain-containing radical SAM protein [Magnetococcales bacterium HHB-1]